MSIQSTRIFSFCCLYLVLFLSGCGKGEPGAENPSVSTFNANITSTQPQSTRISPTPTKPLLPSSLAPTPTPHPSLTPTITQAASPTPRFVLDMSSYDPDLLQPIDISHNPPLIAGANETVALVFDFANAFCMHFPVSCVPEGVLHYAYGEAGEFQTIELTYEIVEEMDSLVARLPAADLAGQPLHYYAEFSIPQANYTQRYPGAGTIDLVTTTEFVRVELPFQNTVKTGEKVFFFSWGFGPENVRQATYEGYPMRVGPPAVDVSEDGKIALLDPVNERILIADSNTHSYTSLPLPFPYRFYADLAFDPDGKLVVCDLQGEEGEGGVISIPACYRLLPDGTVEVSTLVYIQSPSKITRDLKMLDYSDSRLVVPFNAEGEANSREIQREKETWDLPLRYVQGKDPFVAHYADVKAGLTFEVHSPSPLGVLADFAKTPKGYLLVFLIGDEARAVWIDPSGVVQKDVTLAIQQYSEINFNGQVAIPRDGSVYVMSSTPAGIEIQFVAAP